MFAIHTDCSTMSLEKGFRYIILDIVNIPDSANIPIITTLI